MNLGTFQEKALNHFHENGKCDNAFVTSLDASFVFFKTKLNPMNCQTPKLKMLIVLALYFLISGFGSTASAQPDSIVTIRFANPSFTCDSLIYCVDVEYISNTPGLRVFGTNVRFFYPDSLLEIIGPFTGYRNFAPGYGVTADAVPFTGSGSIFGFGTSLVDWENAAVELINPMAPPIFLSTVTWTRLYQICFFVESTVPETDPFCPSLIWDLEQNPDNGGYISGDDGVVITIANPMDPTLSIAVNEAVVQFNWAYEDDTVPGQMGPPYGFPQEDICISIDCSVEIMCAVDTTIQCTESTSPTVTGFATATDNCPGLPVITFSDVTAAGSCPHNSLITRTWVATNTCGGADTCVQLISVVDTIGPSIMCPSNITVQCGFLIPPPNPGLVTATDECGGPTMITFVGETIGSTSCPNQFTLTRTYRADDVCGNFSTCQQTIRVQDDTPPAITCPTDITVTCTLMIPPPNPGLVTATDNCGPAIVVFDADVISNVECDNRYIVKRIYRAIDLCGNSTTCTQSIRVFDDVPPFIACPPPVTVPCANTVPAPDPALVFSFDNCNGTVTNTFVSDAISGMSCPNRFFISRVYRATDGCGNSATCTQTIIVFDATPPAILCPGDVTVQCHNLIPVVDIATVGASDNCGEPSTIVHLGDVVSDSTCFNRLVVTRTYEAIDACGNTSTCNQVITVFDDTPPNITCPLDVTVQCASNVPAPNPNLVIVRENCTGPVSRAFLGDVITNLTCVNRFNVLRSYLITDACGNSSSCSQTITVYDDTPPVINCPGNVTVQCADNVPVAGIGQVTAVDNCGGIPVITYDGEVLVGQTCVDGFNLVRTYRATDECGNSSTCIQMITIRDTIRPTFDTLCNRELDFYTSLGSTCPDASVPSILTNVIAGLPIGESDTWMVGNNLIPSFDGCLADNCTDPDSLLVYPSSFQVTGDACDRVYTFTFYVQDDCGNTSLGLLVAVVRIHDDVAPVMTCPIDVTVECGQSTLPISTGTATATDDCQVDLVISSSDATIPGSCPQELTILRTWSTTDDCGNTSSCVQTISVVDTIPPTFSLACQLTMDFNTSDGYICPGQGQISLVPGQIVGEDEAWTIGNIVLPGLDGCLFDNCSNPDSLVARVDSIIITGDACDRTFTVYFTIIDQCGNESVTEFVCISILHDDVAPVMTCPIDVTIECDESTLPAFTGSATATDACNPPATISSTDQIIPTLLCPQSFGILRTWTASDACGNSSSCVQSITVEDTTPPAIVCPSSVTIECNTDTSPLANGLATATDNCGPVVAVVNNDVTIAGACIQEFTIVRTWTAIDLCGNTSTCVQTLLVDDSTPPFILCPANVTVQCAALVPPANTASVTASDNCGVAVVGFIGDQISGQTCVNRFNVSRTYLAVDQCGNSASCVQTITVFDNTPPSIQCPANITVQCASLVPAPNTALVISSDNCLGLATVTFVNDVIANQTCVNRFNVIRTYRATDDCGNSATCSQTISVFDDTAPFIQCPANITVTCASQVPAPNPALVITSDNCNGLATVTFVNDVPVNQTCVNRLDILRTYRATDECGNSATCSQTISVFDDIVPFIMCPANITVQCASLVPLPNPSLVTSSDNCNGPTTVTFVNDVITNQTCANRFNVIRTYSAADACGNSASCSQTITVFDDTAPVITCPTVVSPVECSSLPSTPSIYFSEDFDGIGGPTAGGAGTYSFPAGWLKVNVDNMIPNPQVSYVNEAWERREDFGLSVIDSVAFSTSYYTPVGSADDWMWTPPVLIQPFSTLSWQARTYDALFQDGYEVRIMVAPNVPTGSAGNLGNMVSSSTLLLTIPNEVSSWITRSLNLNAYSGQTVRIAFRNTSNDKFLLVIDDVTITGNVTGLPNFGIAVATDNCGPTPPAVTFTDVIVPGECPQEFTVTRTWTATDACGNSSSCSRTIEVVDTTPPAIVCPANTTVQCASLVPAPNIALVITSDNCGGSTVTFVSDVINSQTCINRFNVTRTYRATDACGNSATCSQTITVFDNTPPFILCPASITVQCASLVPAPNTALVIASDNCNGLATITFVNDVTSAQTCVNRFNVTRTYRATDECGNSATCSQTITVFDDTVPFIMCPASITVQCASLVPAPNPALVIASDNCNGLASVTFVNDVISAQTCVNRFDLTRTYRATDECGNSATCSQTITVFDNTVPFIMCPANITVQCASLVPAPNPALVISSDNCNGATVTFVDDVISNQTCVNRFNVTRTYRATDECGNSASCSHTITVFDNTVPFIMCPASITVQCASLVPAPNPSIVIASDNCNGLASVTFVDDVISAQTCVNRFNVTRTYRATDECGNSATCSQTITVFDNTAPFIMCPANITVQCASLVPLPNPALVIASDNCNGLASVTFVNDVISAQTCVNRFNVTRTYRATDECGNSATCSQTITVFDNTVPFIMCPASITVQCASLVPAPNPALVIASDNCNGLASVTFVNDVISNQTCVNRFNVTRTYRATDECGNSATCSQTITVFDNTVPFIMCPASITVQCASLVPAPNPALVIASDNCNGVASVTFVNDVISNQTCVNRFNVTRTYRATDECGNSATCSQTITVFDNTIPFIMCPASITVQCASLVPQPNPALVIASDNCNGLASVTFVNDVISNQTCVNRFNVTRTYRATDECGNSATCSQTITVFDNTVPFIMCPVNITVACASQVPLPNPATVVASDNCNGIASVTFVNDVISNQTCVNRFNVTRTYRATDECGNSATCSQTITVFDNIAPSITCPPNVTLQCNTSTAPGGTNGVATGSDNCGGGGALPEVWINEFHYDNVSTDVGEFIELAGPAGTDLSIYTIVRYNGANGTVYTTPTGPVITGIIPNQSNGFGTLFFAYPTDGIQNGAPDGFALVKNGTTVIQFLSYEGSFVAVGGAANGMTSTDIGVLEIGEPIGLSLYLTGSGNTYANFTWTGPLAQTPGALNTGQIFTAFVPGAGPTITSSDVIIPGACPQAMTINRTWRATDACGNSASCLQTLSVIDNTPPAITCPVNVTVQCASQVPASNIASVTASDNCGPATVTFVNDVISNQVCVNRFNITRTYRATDACGNSASCSQTITVFDNTPPSITCPTSITVQCANQVPQPNIASVVSTDNCGGLATVNFVSDVISNQTCVNRFIITRTYSASDACLNTATCSQTITVFDNLAPAFTCPTNVTVQCANLVPPVAEGLTASDNCGGFTPVIFAGEVIANQTCVNRFNLLRTYRATDECGNSSSCTQTITVFDNTPPSITCPGNITVQCANQVPAANPALVVSSDNCGGLATVTFVNDVITNQTCVNRFTITRNYRATDACGNSASCSQTISVFDNIPPSITCPINVTVQCANLVPPANTAGIVSTDNCGGASTVTFADVITNQTCTNRFTLTRTYIATDACANSATCSQTITVFDNTPPSILCPVSVTVQCASLVPAVNTASVVSTDNCGGGSTVSFISDVITNQTCTNRFILTRTYRATDACGNSASCSQTITVFDNTPPTILCPANITVQCASQVPTVTTAGVTANDNCGGVPTISIVSDVITNQTCINRFNVLRTFRATDACGNSATCTQTIVVFDNTPPVLTVIDPLLNGIPNGGRLEVQCLGQDPAFDLPVFTISSVNATDNCAGNITFTFNQVLLDEGNCATDGYILRYRLTWAAIDACGNSSTYSIFMELVDHVAPAIHNVPPDITVNCDEIPDAPTDIFATDECLCACIILFNQTQPAPGCQDGQVVVRSWTAKDDCGNMTIESQNITLIDDEAPELIITQPELANVSNGDILNYTCNEGGIPEFYDDLSAESIFSPVSCGSAGIISFDVKTVETNNCKHFGYLEQRILHWRGVDLCGNVSDLTITARLIDDEAPVLFGVPDTTCVDDPALKDVEATDNCGHPFIRFWDTKIPNPCGNGIAFQRTYEAYDYCGNSMRDTSILIPNDNTHPNITFVNPILADLNFGEILIIECSGANGNYSPFGPEDVSVQDGCPMGLEITFEETIKETRDCSEGVLAVVDLTWYAVDLCGNLAWETITAHVVDTTPPVILNYLPALSIGCDEALPDVEATDNCGDVVITTTETIIPGNCEFKYDVKREITATDPCGNVTVQTQIIHVGVNGGPIIEGVVEEICDDLSIPDVTAFDPCSGKDVSVTMTQDTIDVPECKDGIVIVRTWTAVDVCGDVSVVKQTIIVGDDQAPEIQVPTWSIILKYLEDVGTGLVNLSQEEIMKQLNDLDDGSIFVHDNCDQQIIPVFSLEVTFAGNCAEDGYFEHRVYTWIASDACGNSSSVSFDLNIMDDIAPAFSAVPSDATVICDQLPPVPQVFVDDPAQPVDVVYEQIINPGAGPGEFDVIRRWTATDACGNVAVAEQHIRWIPDTGLSCDIIMPSQVECNSHGVPILSDVFGGLGGLTYEWEVIGEACFIQAGQGTPAIDIYVGWSEVTIVLTITDAFGCTTQCSATLDCVLSPLNPFTGITPETTPEAHVIPGVINAPPYVDQSSVEYLTRLNLWPNPANGSVNLSFESTAPQEVEFTLLNFLGQVILTDKIDAIKGYNSRKVDVSEIPEGGYLMQIKSERAMYSKVVVILHND